MHQDSGQESGILSQMGSTFFGEEITAHSLLAPSGTSGAPADSSSPSLMARSLLGKLAIRKPSILSITSNLSSPGATNGVSEHRNGRFGGSLEDVEKGKPNCIFYVSIPNISSEYNIIILFTYFLIV